jgi:DNA-binding response OmpR family regulator
MKKKILVVDDNPDIVLTIKMGLEELSEQYEVIGASDGQECINYLNDHETPDLILLDIMMPGLNGWDTAAEIKKNQDWKQIPLVFLTAKTDSFSKTFGGMVSGDYITKPFDLDDLYQRIHSILE